MVLLKVFIIFFMLVAINAKNNKECNKNNDKPPYVKIKEKIFCDYDKTVRPGVENEPLIISLHLLLFHFDFMERRNVLSLKGWGVAKWRDEHFYWAPEEYDNATTVLIPPDDIWTPDLVVLNARNKFSTKLMQNTLCIMFYKKDIFCAFPLRISGKCKADFTYWPFDTHNCTVIIESLYHQGHSLDFNETETGMHHDGDKYGRSSWELIDKSVKRFDGVTKATPNISYPSMRFNFVIRRHPDVNVALLLVPFIVLCSMTILALWLNARSSERIYICAFNITCHVFYVLNATWELPTHVDYIPKLILLIRNSLLLITLVLIETLGIRYILSKKGETPKLLVNFMFAFTKTIFGKIFLYPELYSNTTVSVATTSEDDGENLVDKYKVNDWKLLGIFLDRFVFSSIIFVYIVMFAICIPK